MVSNANFINNHANISYPANFIDDSVWAATFDDEDRWTSITISHPPTRRGNREPSGVPLNAPVSIQNLANFLEDDIDDEANRMPVFMFSPPTSRVNQEPWGVPLNTQASIRYPANFPPKIKELIEMVSFRQGRIGQDLRPMIVDVASQNFSDVELADIAAVLSLAPPDILEDIARLMVYIVKSCWQASSRADAFIGDIFRGGPQQLCTSVSTWMVEMQNRGGRQLEGLTSIPLTFREINEIVFLYSVVVVQSTSHPRLRFFIDEYSEEDDSLYGDLFDDDEIGADERSSEMSERIKAYIASLSTVPKNNLDPTDKCGVCYQVYYQGVSSAMKDQQEERFDTALKLPCGHIFCAECLTDWLKTTSSRHFESDGHSICSICRERISIWD